MGQFEVKRYGAPSVPMRTSILLGQGGYATVMVKVEDPACIFSAYRYIPPTDGLWDADDISLSVIC